MRFSLRRFADASSTHWLISAASKASKLSMKALSRLRRYLETDSGRTLLWGMLSGFYLLTFLHRVWSSFGTSLPIVVGVGVAVALGIELALLWRRPERIVSSPSLRRWGMAHLALAAWVVAFDGLVGVAMRVAGRLSAESLANFGVSAAFGCGTCIGLLTVPVFLISRLPSLRPMVATSFENSNHKIFHWINLTSYFSGLALGLAVATLVLAPLCGIQWLGLGAALISGVVFLVSLRPSRTAVESETTETFAAESDGNARAGLAAAATGTWQIIAITTLGALLAAGSRLLEQLTPSAGYLVYCEWGALLAGIAIGLRFAQSQGHRGSGQGARSIACLVAATFVVAILACDSTLISGMLSANAHISSVSVIMAARIAVTAALFVPVGFAWGTVSGYRLQATGYSRINAGSGFQAPGSSQTIQEGTVDVINSAVSSVAPSPPRPLAPSHFAPAPLAFVAGFLMVRLYLISVAPLAWLIIGACWVLGALAFVNWLPTRPMHRRWIGRIAIAAAVCVVAIAPLFRGLGQGDVAAKLLFATNVFGAKQNHTHERFLPVLDEGRLIANIPGDHGTLTVWKYRGLQLVVRDGGVPKAVISTQPEICPEYSPEKMHTILPLLLHEHPQSVLLLGLGGGDGVATCLSFPIASITGIEDDRGLIKSLHEVVWPECGVDPLADNRFRLLSVDPALAIADAREKYDVIISRPDQSALWQSTPYYTLEFYRNAAARLEADGVFCQRFQQIDLGPEPMRVLTRTMQGAFAEVIAVETGMGEIVMLGSNSPGGIVHKGFKERLQRTHVRRALAQMGWDWTVPLNLFAFQNESLAKFAADGPKRMNTSANGRFAFTLPQEVIRWGDKMQEQRDALNSHAIAMLAWPNCDFGDPEVLWRLSEVAGRQNLMTKFPDQQWAYRKALKERMEKDKTSLVHQIRRQLDEEELHPQDQQRKDYLIALGKAASDPAPSKEEIDAVAAFVEPFDPLLSYFVHHEVAELLKRSPNANPQEELKHRLHLAYYADGRDQSVRNVAAAIELLANSSDGSFEPVERFDQLNALLQMMKIRWETRGIGKTKSVTYVLNDVDKSVSAIEHCFTEIDNLLTEVNLPGIDWPTRRAYLETTLVRPLRAYRQELTALHLKQKQRTEELLSQRKKKKAESESLLPPLGN